jgi:hypothetical protein
MTLRSPAAKKKTADPCSRTFSLQERTKLPDGEARVTNDAAEGEGVDRIVAWNRNYSGAIGHNDVLALPDDYEPGLLERAYGVEMIDAGDPRQDLNRYLDLANFFATKSLIDDGEISANGIFDVLDSFCFGGALRPTPG